jgi:hypothetical protein
MEGFIYDNYTARKEGKGKHRKRFKSRLSYQHRMLKPTNFHIIPGEKVSRRAYR